MKRLLFSLFLLFACQTIFAQKNSFGVGNSYSFVADPDNDGIIGLTSLSLNYERQVSPKWSYSVAAIGQKSKPIETIVNASFDLGPTQTFRINTTHRLLGFEHLMVYHPRGFNEKIYYGIGLNTKLYISKNNPISPNTPKSILIGIGSVEGNIVLALGYNELFDNGFRIAPFMNLGLGIGIIPVEFRAGCNVMFGGNFFKGLKKK